MKARFLPAVFLVSFLLPAAHLRTASNGNPSVFSPTVTQTTIQTPPDVSAPHHPL